MNKGDIVREYPFRPDYILAYYTIYYIYYIYNIYGVCIYIYIHIYIHINVCFEPGNETACVCFRPKDKNCPHNGRRFLQDVLSSERRDGAGLRSIGGDWVVMS